MSLRSTNFHLPYFIILATVASNFQTTLTLPKFCWKYFINRGSVCSLCPKECWIIATPYSIQHGPGGCVTAVWGESKGGQWYLQTYLVATNTWWGARATATITVAQENGIRQYTSSYTRTTLRRISLLLLTAKLTQGQHMFPQTPEVKPFGPI